jgi:hypothetical protein
LHIQSRYSGAPDFYLEEIDVRVPLPDGDYHATLKSVCKMPLRHRKGENMFRMVENLAKVEMDGATGDGWIEAADLIVEGIPLGNSIS